MQLRGPEDRTERVAHRSAAGIRGQGLLFTGAQKPSAHLVRGDEVRALREMRRQYPDPVFVFATEHGSPFTPDVVNPLFERIGERAGLALPVLAHMLRRSCGHALANAGHGTRSIEDWPGHRSIQHTTRYTQLSAAPFKDFWR